MLRNWVFSEERRFAYDLIDSLFDRFINQKNSPSHITWLAFVGSLDTGMTDEEHKNEAAQILRMMESIDTKTSALLQHISIMIAALMFSYTAGSHSSLLYSFFILIEISIYMILTVLCIRCIGFTIKKYVEDTNVEGAEIAYEFLRRRYIYNFTSNAVIVVTIATMLTLLLGGLMLR